MRMQNQRLLGKPFETSEEVVRWLAAVQAQDFGPAKWSIGQRTLREREAAVHEAFSKGSILRTHVLRPTWHFVLPEDIRWLLELTAPRVHSRMSSYYRRLGLNEPLFKKSNSVITRALKGGEHRTRKDLGTILIKSGIEASGGRLAFILMQAELNGIVCSGDLHGKQQTYALLEERAPKGVNLTNEEALFELTRRYFTSHGPATVRDFSWWSSLKVSDIRRGLDMVGSTLESASVDGLTYWFKPPLSKSKVRSTPVVHLLQGYDEYIVAYTQSKFLLNLAQRTTFSLTDRPVFTGAVVIDGQVEGHWRSKVEKGSRVVEAAFYEPLDKMQSGAINEAVAQYGKYLGAKVRLEAKTLD
jgi:hypothetical protein